MINRLLFLAMLAMFPLQPYEPPAPRVQECVSVDVYVAMERYQNARIDRLERKFNRVGPEWHVPPRATIEIQDRWAVLGP